MVLIPQWLSEGWVIALVVLAGLAFGSFVTLVSYRLPRDEPLVAGRSRCPSCKTTLRLPALFPLLSWLWQRGKCRYCGVGVSARYPLTELAQALLFLLVYVGYGLTWQALILAMLSVALMVMVVVDFEWYIIPDEVQICCAVLAIVFHVVMDTPVALVAAGLAMGVFIGFALRFGYGFIMRKEGLGWGDVKFLAVAGLWLASVEAWPPFLFYAGVWGVVTALVWRALGRGARFPFGPALAASLLMALLTPSGSLFFWTIERIYA